MTIFFSRAKRKDISELRGYFFRHKVGSDVGFSWNKDDPSFAVDHWECIEVAPVEQTSIAGAAKGGIRNELSEDRIHEIWNEAYAIALNEAGFCIGNGDVAHWNQPIVFARLLATQSASTAPGQADTERDAARWESEKAELVSEYPGIAGGFCVLDVLITTELGCNIEAGEYGFSIISIINGGIESSDMEKVAECIADNLDELNLPEEGQAAITVYESGERDDVYWNKFYRIAALPKENGQ